MPVGLVEGLSSGVQGFLQQYDTERDFQNKLTQQALQKRIEEDRMKREYTQQQASLLQNNMVADQAGAVSLDPLGQKRKQLEQVQTTHGLEKFDPNSEASKNTGLLATGLMKQAFPGGQVSVPAGMSAADINDENGLLKSAIPAGFGMQGRVLSNERMGQSLDIKRQGLQLRTTDQATKAANFIHDDNQIKTNSLQLQQLDGSIGVLTKPGGPTPQELNDAQIEISNAAAGARSSALGKLERTEYNNLEQQSAHLKQYLTSNPQALGDTETVQRVLGLAKQLKAIIAKHQGERAESLRKNYKNNPEAQDEQEKAIQTYKRGVGSENQQSTDKNMPKTVIQDGHTYTLNPASGRYE